MVALRNARMYRLPVSTYTYEIIARTASNGVTTLLSIRTIADDVVMLPPTIYSGPTVSGLRSNCRPERVGLCGSLLSARIKHVDTTRVDWVVQGVLVPHNKRDLSLNVTVDRCRCNHYDFNK